VLARRLLLLVAVLMGLTVLATGLAPPPPKQPVQSSPTPSAGVPPADVAPIDTVQLTVDASRTKPKSVVANSGDVVHLTVSADSLDAVEIVGLDLLRAVAPDSPAEFDLLAPAGTHEFPIVLTQAGRTAGTLRITGSE
jgi:hypothetical protein